MRNKEKKPINVEVGRNIRFYREQAGYSREKFSELIGVSPRFISDVETGFVGISLTSLKRICELLGISSDRLIWGCKEEIKLDERISHLDNRYLEFLEQMIKLQLEVISVTGRDNTERKTRN